MCVSVKLPVKLPMGNLSRDGQFDGLSPGSGQVRDTSYQWEDIGK